MKNQKNETVIRDTTIVKGLNYFTDINKHLQENSGRLTTDDNIRIAEKHNTANYLIYYATTLGYMQRIERGVYKSVKTINSEDLKKIIYKYLEVRSNGSIAKKSKDKATPKNKVVKKQNGKEKIYKPRGFSSLLNQTDKYFVVNHRGLPLTKPMGVRRAKALAENYAKKDSGNSFYVAEIKFGVAMKYVTTTQNI